MGKKGASRTDRGLLILTLLLTALGLVAIADASAPLALSVFADSLYFVKQQAVWGVIGVGVLLLSSKINYLFWKRLSPVFFGVSVVLLVLVLLPGIGSKFLGARRWLEVGPVNFQPSELIKLNLALFFAWLAETKKPIYWYVAALGLVSALIMLQPDLGTTIIVVAIGLVQIFVAGFSLSYLFLLVSGGALLTALLTLVSSYRRERLLTFLRGSTDPLGSSYHIRQVLIALGSGGLLGVGLGQGKQKHLFLPESATDSVFAVIAEELGFVGASFLIILLFLLVFKMIKIARRAPDDFSGVLAAGIATWLGGQMFLNIASMLALVPLTGVPLPFFSYGGSSLTAILFGIGILINISKHGKDKR